MTPTRPCSPTTSAELAIAYPEVTALKAYDDAVEAARRLADDASITAALDLSDALDSLADHFDDRPDATFVPDEPVRHRRARRKRQRGRGRSSRPARPAHGAWRGLRRAVRRPVDPDHPRRRGWRRTSRTRSTRSCPPIGPRPASTSRPRATRTAATPSASSSTRARSCAMRPRSSAPRQQATSAAPTAQFADVQDTLAADFQKVGLITIVGILLVLMLLLRAIVAPLYLVGTVLVSYGSTIGISAFLFQEVLGQPGTSPYLPLIVFVLLVALGADYNIFLMHRVREECEHALASTRASGSHRGAPGRSSPRPASSSPARSGRWPTSPVIILFQVGVAVAIGVLIDTFLVRSILVPAITTLVGDRAWWPSGASIAALLGRLAGPQVAAPVPVAGRRSDRRSRRMTGAASPGPARALDSPSRWRSRSWCPVVVVGLLTWSFGAASGNLGSVRRRSSTSMRAALVPAVGWLAPAARAGSRPGTGPARRRWGLVHLGGDRRGMRGRRPGGRHVRRRPHDPGRVQPLGGDDPQRHRAATRPGRRSRWRPTTAPATRSATSRARSRRRSAPRPPRTSRRPTSTTCWWRGRTTARNAHAGGSTMRSRSPMTESRSPTTSRAPVRSPTTVSSGLRQLADGASSATAGRGSWWTA